MDTRTAICPGTYDPPTLGHVDIIRRSARIFENVIVGVVRHPQHKQPLFSDQQRVELLRDALADLPNVRIEVFSNLVVNFAREQNASVLVKGLRAISDFEWEFQMTLLNAGQDPEVETVFLMSNSKYSFVSSSGVRELAAFGGDISHYVTPLVQRELLKRFPQSE